MTQHGSWEGRRATKCKIDRLALMMMMQRRARDVASQDGAKSADELERDFGPEGEEVAGSFVPLIVAPRRTMAPPGDQEGPLPVSFFLIVVDFCLLVQLSNFGPLGCLLVCLFVSVRVCACLFLASVGQQRAPAGDRFPCGLFVAGLIWSKQTARVPFVFIANRLHLARKRGPAQYLVAKQSQRTNGGPKISNQSPGLLWKLLNFGALFGLLASEIMHSFGVSAATYYKRNGFFRLEF